MQVSITWRDPVTGTTGEWAGDLPCTIGRTAQCTVDHPQLSRSHARLDYVGGALKLEDLKSSNGTFVAGERVEHASLADSGDFRLGPVQFTAILLADEAEKTVAPPEAIETVLAADPESGSATVFEEEEPSLEADAEPAPIRLHISWRNVETGDEGATVVTPPATLGSQQSSSIQLQDARVSRSHATVSVESGEIFLSDDGSSNGTFVDDQRVETANLGGSGSFAIRPYRIAVWLEGEDEPAAMPAQTIAPTQAVDDFDEEASIFFDDERGELTPTPPAEEHGFPPPEFSKPVVSVESLERDFPVEEFAYLAIGGGLGSFIWVDNLRVYGVPTDGIGVIGLEPKPHGRYERLCINSQIPAHERLRSDSASTPDCLWGWPGYAVREAWKALGRGDLSTTFKSLWQIFVEPTFSPTYTPVSGVVFDSIEKEATRIGWSSMWKHGRVKAIRKTDDGRYAVAYTVPGDSSSSRHRIAVGRYVHVAVGYPGIRLLPDLQTYRIETGDMRRVINAYEEHGHVYEDLARNGGIVLIRGWGIVASRIIQHLYEVRRDRGADVHILHLTRSIVGQGNRYRRAQRKVENNWEFQPFNWPKAAWGGDLRFVLESASNDGRAELYKMWGGTTTADRTDWADLIDEGRREGWYQIREGEVDHVEPGPEDTLSTVIRGRKTLRDETRLDTNYIIDCTGLQSGIESHPLLKDLVEHHQLGRNVQGRLDVENDFEIRGMANGQGRIYASGVSTLGGPYAPVDSFLGLQYAAQRSVDALVRHGAPRLRHLGPGRSFSQWMRWARNQTP
ncbi:MAG: FHA domain-containing protein [Rubricoccaceae bacterium]|nr:FHA domain-containing protein [Rubricoccaceae bacterium]